MDESKQSNKAIIAAIVVVLLVVATTGVIALSGKKETPSVSAVSSTGSGSVGAASATSTSSPVSYKDGSYKTTTNYMTPGGSESIDVNVTVVGGVITATDMQGHPTTRDASEYQDLFMSGYQSAVVGKKLSDLSLDRVAGASLTSGGFNDALDTIRSDAKV